MARPKTHKDVEFHTRDGKVFKHLDEAAGHAVIQALSGQAKQVIDVVIWSLAGAQWFGGDAGAEQYNEDPEASVFERISLLIDSEGRVA